LRLRAGIDGKGFSGPKLVDGQIVTSGSVTPLSLFDAAPSDGADF
jgi:hypothetical protein